MGSPEQRSRRVQVNRGNCDTNSCGIESSAPLTRALLSSRPPVRTTPASGALIARKSRIHITCTGIGPFGSHGCSRAASATYHVADSIMLSATSMSFESRTLLSSSSPESPAFGIGDLPGVSHNVRDVVGTHQASTTAVSCRGTRFLAVLVANSSRGPRAGSALTPAMCSTRSTRGAALTMRRETWRWAA